MKINKVTVGFVIQEYDTGLNEFVRQRFIAGDDITWETKDCQLVSPPPEAYLPYEMKQPGEMKKCSCREKL